MDEDPRYKTAHDDDDDDAQALGSTHMVCFTCLESFPHKSMHPMNCRRDHAMCMGCMKSWREKPESKSGLCTMCKKRVPKIVVDSPEPASRKRKRKLPAAEAAAIESTAERARAKRLLVDERDELKEAIAVIDALWPSSDAAIQEARAVERVNLEKRLAVVAKRL